jgi:hypothetical protein
MPEIVTDLKPVDELKAMRNKLAHGTRVEACETEFETEFSDLENITAQFFVEFPEGLFHDQGDAKWIAIRRSSWGHNDMPCGRPGSGRPQGVFGGLSYY